MNEEEFQQIFNQYKNNIYYLALSYTKNTKDAEDIVQNTFLKLYNRKDNFKDEEHLKRWLIKVTINNAKSLITSLWFKLRNPFDEAVYNDLVTSFEHNDLIDALYSLKKEERLIMHLFYFENYKIKEIALILKQKESTIKVKLHRARLKFKKILKEEWNYEE